MQEARGVVVEPDRAGFAVLLDLDLPIPQDVLCPRPDTDKGVACDPLAALDGFQEEGWAVPAQLEVQADGRFEIGVDLADECLDCSDFE